MERKTKEILTFAVDVGSLMLSSGAEIYRVKETIVHMIKGLGIVLLPDLIFFIRSSITTLVVLLNISIANTSFLYSQIYIPILSFNGQYVTGKS